MGGISLASVIVPASKDRFNTGREIQIAPACKEPVSVESGYFKKGATRVIVAIPCYNEEIAIGSMVLKSLRYATQVLVIDDGSTDSTADLARAAGAEVLVHEKNMGKGAGIRDAFAYARANDADVLVLLDGDGQHDPYEIPQLLEPILNKQADMVNGSRFLVRNGHNVPAYRRVGQEVLTLFTNAGSKQKITDSQNGFRAFARHTFDCFSFRQNGMGIESEMLMDAARAKLDIKEVQINVRYDVAGSTFNPVRHGLGVLNSVLALISRRRPLMFFALPGTVLLFAGMILALTLFDNLIAEHIFATGSVMVSILCITVGVLGIFTGITLNSLKRIESD